MANLKLLNLFVAFSALAIIACLFAAAPSNALSVDTHNVVRHVLRNHDNVSRRKRASGKRCRDRQSAPQPSDSHKDKTKPKPSNKESSQQGGNNGMPSGPRTGKRGLAWPNGDKDLEKFQSNEISFMYTWTSECPSRADELGLECCRMLWGEREIENFKRFLKNPHGPCILGFNEPNDKGQSDMSPQRAAQVWKQFIQPLKSKGYKLISPATTSAPSGKTWMKDFFEACDGCTFDGIAMHYYDITAGGMIQYITDFHNTFNLPIWVTEYACQNFNGGAQCSKDGTFNFHQDVVHSMDKTDFVEKYSPFGAMLHMQGVNQFNQLMDPGGGPSYLFRKLYLGR